MDEPVAPTPDGKLRILRRDNSHGPNHMEGGWWEYFPFHEISSHGPVAVGWQIRYDTHRTLIPWHEIIEVDIVYNSEGYQRLLDEYQELVHVHHIHQGEETKEDCLPCIKIKLSDPTAFAGSVMEVPPESNRDKPFWS